MDGLYYDHVLAAVLYCAAGCAFAAATSLSNTFVCQPQQRNMHGRIFGGFLMRRAFELGFATTYLFAGSRPSFVRVDEVTFRYVFGCTEKCARILQLQVLAMQYQARGPAACHAGAWEARHCRWQALIIWSRVGLETAAVAGLLPIMQLQEAC